MKQTDPAAREEPTAPPVSLGRLRSALTVLYLGAAFLAIGGFLEQWSGVPNADQVLVNRYWLLFFALNSLAFGGAALIGALPQLAVRPIKWLWTGLLLVLYALAFSTWLESRPPDLLPTLAAWAAKLPAYLPAALSFLNGLLWGHLSEEAPPPA